MPTPSVGLPAGTKPRPLDIKIIIDEVEQAATRKDSKAPDDHSITRKEFMNWYKDPANLTKLTKDSSPTNRSHLENAVHFLADEDYFNRLANQVQDGSGIATAPLSWIPGVKGDPQLSYMDVDSSVKNSAFSTQ